MATAQTERQANPSKADLERTGRILRDLRISRGLSPEQLGARIGVSGRTIRRIENAEVIPLVRTMFALAEWAEKEVADLWRL